MIPEVLSKRRSRISTGAALQCLHEPGRRHTRLERVLTIQTKARDSKIRGNDAGDAESDVLRRCKDGDPLSFCCFGLLCRI